MDVDPLCLLLSSLVDPLPEFPWCGRLTGARLAFNPPPPAAPENRGRESRPGD
ncbi:MAG: hypothetical protein ACI9K5_003966, partial [Gammaproteobacteria bacterium]